MVGLTQPVGKGSGLISSVASDVFFGSLGLILASCFLSLQWQDIISALLPCFTLLVKLKGIFSCSKHYTWQFCMDCSQFFFVLDDVDRDDPA